jgi:hypothetical protein
MKSEPPATPPRRSRPGARAAGTSPQAAGAAAERRSGVGPTPGWKGTLGARTRFANPRAPSVPATLDITAEEYYAAATLMGLLASQADEPNKKWVRDWSFCMGDLMAVEARRRRRVRR